MNNKKQAIFFLSALFFCTTAMSSFAQSLETAFGGEIITRRLCTCSFSTLLTIKNHDGQTLKLTYIPGMSIIYMTYNFMGASYLLGTYNPAMRNMCYAYNSSGNCKLLTDDGALGIMPGTGFN